MIEIRLRQKNQKAVLARSDATRRSPENVACRTRLPRPLRGLARTHRMFQTVPGVIENPTERL